MVLNFESQCPYLQGFLSATTLPRRHQSHQAVYSGLACVSLWSRVRGFGCPHEGFMR